MAVNSQPGSGSGRFEDVPQYGSISLLAIARAAYGYKKLKAKK